MKCFKRLLPLCLALALLAGCGAENAGGAGSDNSVPPSDSNAAETDSPGGAGDPVLTRVGSLNGPTSMGLVSLMERSEQEQLDNDYDFTVVTAADELLGLMATGDLDIALVPANVAANLYQKMEGGIAAIDINTLGVLYIVTADETVTELADLAGRTLCLTGKGTTPDYAIQYLLAEYGVEDVTLEYKSEATEVAATLAADSTSSVVGLLPQPFVTVALSQNERLRMAIDLSAQWDALDNGSRLVTGVTVVRRAFLEEHPQAVETFLADHTASAAYTEEHPEETAQLVADAGIVAQAPVALKALPYCSIVCITGQEMREALSGYLAVLYGQSPDFVGGALPDDAFYYLP